MLRFSSGVGMRVRRDCSASCNAGPMRCVRAPVRADMRSTGAQPTKARRSPTPSSTTSLWSGSEMSHLLRTMMRPVPGVGDLLGQTLLLVGDAEGGHR